MEPDSKILCFRAVAHSIPNAALINGATGLWTIEIENKHKTLRDCTLEIYPDEIGNSVTSYRKIRNDDGGTLSTAKLIEGGCLEVSITRLAQNRSLIYVVGMAVPGQPVVSGIRIGVRNQIHQHVDNRIISGIEKLELSKLMHFRMMVLMLLFLGTTAGLYVRIAILYGESILIGKF